MPPEGLSRNDYFIAALDFLSVNGPDHLTIAALCGELGVTKGSFYHHFKDLPSFVDGMLAYWSDEHATRLIALSEAMTDPGARMDLLRQIAIGLPHGAEAAIRAWSWSNPRVAVVVAQVDHARLEHVTAAAVAAGLEPVRAHLMATISLSTLIGMQQLDRPAQPGAMEAVFTALESWALQPVAL